MQSLNKLKKKILSLKINKLNRYFSLGGFLEYLQLNKLQYVFQYRKVENLNFKLQINLNFYLEL